MDKIFVIFFFTISFQLFATSPKDAFALAKKGKAVLVDVREKDEIKEGMVKGAKWFPLSKIETDPDWKKEFTSFSKGKEVFLYCRSGKRSGKVESVLKKEKIEAENIGGYLELQKVLPIEIP